MKIIPAENIIPEDSVMSGEVIFNPFSDIPPRLQYSFGVYCKDVHPEIEKFDLFLGGIVLRERNWKTLYGHYQPKTGPRWEGGSVYVDSAHNPVDVFSLDFLNRSNNTFEVRADIFVDFDFEGVDFEDLVLSLDFKTVFHGIRFCVPNWTDPSKVNFPPEWRIPGEFTQETVDELVSRFVDLSEYSREREHGHFVYKPN